MPYIKCVFPDKTVEVDLGNGPISLDSDDIMRIIGANPSCKEFYICPDQDRNEDK